jgi:hypothetical protein
MIEVTAPSGRVYTRCGCYGILDYVYHIFWRCRDCGKLHERIP